MSGAGETRNSRTEVIERDAARVFPPAETSARAYWVNGVTWTVHRTSQEARRGWRAMPARIAASLRHARIALVRALMRPSP
jgi:hypothetical protein